MAKQTTGYVFKRGDVFYCQWRYEGKNFVRRLLDPDGNPCTTQKDADTAKSVLLANFRARDKAEVLSGIAGKLGTVQTEIARLDDEKNPPLRIVQGWSAYVESETRPQSGPVTMANYEGHWSAFTDWMKEHHAAAIYLRDVTPDMAAAFIRHLGKQHYSGNRINKFSRFLKTFFRVLAKPARITTNPFDEIAHRNHLPESKRPFTVEELKAIIERAEGELKTLFMIGTFTGLRLADAATLQWGEVDLHRGIIRRIPRKTSRTGKAVILGIPAILSEHLAGLSRKGPFVMPEAAALYEADAPALSRRITAHLTTCGIQTVKPGTGIEVVKDEDGKAHKKPTGKRAVVIAGFHSLRHSFVSLHAQAGTPQAVLQKLAGHGNPIMTEHYTHISEATARQSADAFPHIMGAEPVKALHGPHMIEAATVRKLAGKLNGKTWRNVKTELERLSLGSN